MGIFDKIFKSNKAKENNSIVRNMDWNFYSYEYEENEQTFKSLIEFDVQHANENEHKILLNGLRFIQFINPELCSENGLATRDLAMELLQIQKEVLNNIKSDSRFVAKLSYDYLVELIFQTNDIEKLKKELSLVSVNNKIIKTEFRTYPTWSFFDKKIRPDTFFRQKIADREVITQLIKAGSNTAIEHELEHFFIGDSEKLEFVSEQLKPDGFKLKYIKEDKMLLIQKSKLDLDEISKFTGRIKTYAEKIGISYDGWGTKVER